MERGRRVAIAVPARDEAERIGVCLSRLAALPHDARVRSLDIVVLANNCEDETARVASQFGPRCTTLNQILEPERANAGWARRLALDAAANRLRSDRDILLSTDADTVVAYDWLSRTLDHLDAGWDAVAGLARLDPRERRGLDRRHRRRLALIQRHENALTRLRAASDDVEPWPRHFYEGGASIATTLGVYRRIGGAPTPAVGEDKAMFDAIRSVGGQVRHPTDVRVVTSARLIGRAPGGASDTLALWAAQTDAEPVHGVSTAAGGPVTFATLAATTTKARGFAAIAMRTADATDRADRPRLAG